MADPPAAGDRPWTLADLLWERLSEAALAAHHGAKDTLAGAWWQAAADLADAFAPDDPRRAVALHNLAVARHAAGATGEAAALLRAALAAWDAAETWIAAMHIGRRARSSLFHLRLELKHRERYAALARDDHRRRVADARARTAAGLAALAGAPSPAAPSSPATPFSPDGAPLDRWAADRGAPFTDSRIAAATHLLAALTHP